MRKMEEPIIRKRNKYKILFLIIVPILSGLSGILIATTISQRMYIDSIPQSQEDLLEQYYNNWQEAQENYEQAYQDYLEAQENYEQAYQDYLEAQANYEQAYQDYLNILNEYNTYKQQVKENTEFSGHFLTLIDWSSYYGTISHIDEVQIGYEDYFSYRLDYPHPSHSYSNKWIVADVIASYCFNSTPIYTIASDIMDVMDTAVDPTDENRIDALLSLVQDRGNDTICINYISDGTDDFAKYPIETLTEGNGDCEDKSILFVSLCASVGYSCAIFVITGHVFAGVYLDSTPTHNTQIGAWYVEINGLNYWTCETTIFGWRIGDLPVSSQGQSVYYQIVEF